MKKLIFLAFVFLAFKNLYAQVNLQTGSAEYKVSIFDWKDSKSNLSLAISLNYNSGNGLKVDEIASNIGQGWNLMAGGAIFRTQVGQPDDQKPREGTNNDLSKYPAGYLYSTNNPVNGIPERAVHYPIYENSNQRYRPANEVADDKEIDRFTFYFNGRSGSFILNKGIGTSSDFGITIGDSKLKIWFEKDETLIQQGIRTSITAFYIQDENSLIYKFRKHSISKLLTRRNTQSSLDYPVPQQPYSFGSVNYESDFDENHSSPTFVTGNPYVINGWYLTEIEDPIAQKKILFTYESRQITNSVGQDVQTIRTLIGNYSNFSADQWYVKVTNKVSNTVTPYISKIVFHDGYQVDFLYNKDKPRVDLNGDFPLSSIDIKLNQRNVSKYSLNTTYFLLNNYASDVIDNQRKYARLCLRSIQRTGVDLKEAEKPISFDYYLGSTSTNDDIVPPPFCSLKDIWGYFNGNMANSINSSTPPITYNSSIYELSYQQLRSLCFIYYGNSMGYSLNYNTIKQNYAKNGLLKSINLALGGSINYEYEQRKFFVNGENKYMGGVSVSKVIYKKDNSTTATSTEYKYISSDLNSSLIVPENPTNIYTSSYFYEPEDSHYIWDWSCIFGCCVYRYTHPGSLDDITAEIVPNKTFSSEIGLINSIALAQFLPLASNLINAKDPVDFIRRHFLPTKVSLIHEIVTNIVQTINSCISEDQITRTVLSYKNSNRNLINPLPSFYKTVEVIETGINNSQSNGKVVYQFTSPDDYPIWEVDNINLSQKQRFANWSYGLPKTITTYNSNGDKIKEQVNTYNFSNAKRDLNISSCNAFIKKTKSLNNQDYFASVGQYLTTSNNDLIVDIYSIYTGRVELTETRERIYKIDNINVYNENVTNFFYNPLNFQLNKISNQLSNGDKAIIEIYYPIDYNPASNTPIQKMITNNIINIPIATYKSIQKNNTNTISHIDAKVTEFTELSNGLIKPLKVYTDNTSHLVSNFQFSPTDLFNYPGLKVVETYGYYLNGNLAVIKDEGDRKVSNIYDYNDKLIIASVINADPYLDKLAYTSFQTDFLGGWRIYGTPNYSSTSSITGQKSFSLTNNNGLEADLINTQSYRLTFWSTSVNFHVGVEQSGGVALASPQHIGPTYNGFTYYEYLIPKTISPTKVTISRYGNTNTNIDELRLYPDKARLRSITYDPLIGKTSECDENNRIKYYEYDALGRLFLIKDEKKNILKMYEYNIKK